MSVERNANGIPPIEWARIDPVLARCLLDSDGLELSGIPFPAHFNFAWCEPAILQMLNETKLVPILSEEKRAAIRKEFQKHSDEPVYTDVQDIIEEVFLMQEEEKGVGERMRVVFARPAAPNDFQVEFGPITHGEYGEVKSELVTSGRISLLKMHTHPRNALFSPQDYKTLITDIRAQTGGLRRRLFYATMVICPDVQVLALASSATPLFTDEEAEKFVQETDRNFDEQFKAQWQLDRVVDQNTGEDFLAILKFHKSELLALMRNLRAKVSKGEMSIDERRRLAEEFFITRGDDGKKIIESERRTREKRNRIYNAQLVEVARNLNIKLYTSTNMEDFYAASA